MYQKYFKRFIDICASAGALIILSPLLLILTVTGAIAMGGNPFFTQLRPGKKGPDGQEKIFRLIKFRSMSNRKSPDGKLLPDAQRLNRYGKLLRASSLDELPELINILKGDMSLVGPRPQLVRDMVFMTAEQRRRHDVRPGLTGLAQINGRNCIAWEDKFRYDLTYIDSGITLWGDIRILLQTISKVLKHTDTVREGTVSDMDLGDWLLETETVTPEEYEEKQAEAKTLLNI